MAGYGIPDRGGQGCGEDSAEFLQQLERGLADHLSVCMDAGDIRTVYLLDCPLSHDGNGHSGYVFFYA